MDVYRRKIRAERSLPDFMLFILFFPHLVAGPIVRARDFLPQVKRPKRRDWARCRLGGQYLLLGLVKKAVVADRLAQLADPVFADPSAYGTGALWAALLAYAIQIYCDFSGYSDMALGSAHLLGYKLAPNFNLPYLSANPSEFWRRWHISLSGWLRDHLFIPLGGSRGGRGLVYRNLLVTMVLGGLWHGASWTFVVWGLLHGLLLIAHRAVRALAEARPWLDRLLRTAPGTLLRVATTFLGVCLGWVLFRATTFPLALTFLRRLFTASAGAPVPLGASVFVPIVFLVALAHALGAAGTWAKWYERLPAPVRGFGYAAALALALLLTPMTSKTFIYFQF
jgi:alginate O-acetyltransferase complex protein AlgI